MIIYADILILINIFLTYFLLECTKLLSKKIKKEKRFILASLIGGFYSATILIPNISATTITILNILSSFLILIIAFPFFSVKDFFRVVFIFFLVNFFFAGFMLLVTYYFSPSKMIYQGGKIYFDIQLKTLLISSAICYALLEIFEKFLKHRGESSLFYNICLGYQSKYIKETAYLDTGNSLRDAFSTTPVLIVDPLVSKELLGDTIENILLKNKSVNSQKLKFRPIPYKDMSGEGFLNAILIDSVDFLQSKKTISPVIMAESKHPFANQEYQVLLSNQFTERGSIYDSKKSNQKMDFKTKTPFFQK